MNSYIKTFFSLSNRFPDSSVKFFKSLKRKSPKNLDEIVHELHNNIFQNIDCLECANCCKSISPGVKDKDIERLAKHIRMRPSELVDKYFYLDHEGDYVFKETPCPFLMSDNYCSVYEARPKACREYPHTDRRRFIQLLNITKKNVEVCPAVYFIVEDLKLKI